MLRATAAVGSDVVGAELPPGHGAASRQAFDNGERIYRARDELLGIAGWGAALFEPLLLDGRPGGRPDRLLERPSRRWCPSARCS